MKRTKTACFGMLLGVFFLTGTVSVSADPLLHMVTAGAKEVLEEFTKKRAKELVKIYVKAGGALSREALERAAQESVERASRETGEIITRNHLQLDVRKIFNRGIRKAGYEADKAIERDLLVPTVIDLMPRWLSEAAEEQAKRELAREIRDEIIAENIKNRYLARKVLRARKHAPVPDLFH